MAGSAAARAVQHAGLTTQSFYAIFVHEEDGSLHSIGDAIDDGVDRGTVEVPQGTVALWPLKPDGSEMLWGLTPDVLRRNWGQGWARVNNWKPDTKKGTVQYLPGGTIDRIHSGAITVTGRAADGSVVGYLTPEVVQGLTPKRVWHLPSHNAETGAPTSSLHSYQVAAFRTQSRSMRWRTLCASPWEGNPMRSYSTSSVGAARPLTL